MFSCWITQIIIKKVIKYKSFQENGFSKLHLSLTNMLRHTDARWKGTHLKHLFSSFELFFYYSIIMFLADCIQSFLNQKTFYILRFSRNSKNKRKKYVQKNDDFLISTCANIFWHVKSNCLPSENTVHVNCGFAIEHDTMSAPHKRVRLSRGTSSSGI